MARPYMPATAAIGQRETGGLPQWEASTLSCGMQDTVGAVHFQDFANLSVPAARGQTLLETSLRARLPHFHQCRGMARCTTCRVRVLEGGASLSPRTGEELQISTERGWGDDIRLACQARVLGDVTIERLVRDEGAATALFPSETPLRQGEEKRVAVMFCDMRGFTRLAAGQLAHDVIHVLNRFLHAVCEPVLANRGYIDKYLGDGFLAVFGLDGGASPCLDATRAALRMPERVAALNRSLEQGFGVTIDFGVGLHFGDVVVGDMGHPQKTQFSVIGDTVNVASRIEQSNKRFGTRILASSAFLAQVASSVKTGQRRRARIASRWETLHEITALAGRERHVLVEQSRDRILLDPHRFGTLFYARLFRERPEIESLFARTNMERMHEVFLHALDEAVRHIDDLSLIADPLRELGLRHESYGVRREYYADARRALVATVAEFFGEGAQPDLLAAWSDFLDDVAQCMAAGAK
jgi:class 3 adenylate cyclase/hemoglobin-like flavoprotein